MKGRRIGAGSAVSKCEFRCPFPLNVEEGLPPPCAKGLFGASQLNERLAADATAAGWTPPKTQWTQRGVRLNSTSQQHGYPGSDELRHKSHGISGIARNVRS